MPTHNIPSFSSQYRRQLLFVFILGIEFVSFPSNLLDLTNVLVECAAHIIEVTLKGSDVSLACGSCLESYCRALHL